MLKVNRIGRFCKNLHNSGKKIRAVAVKKKEVVVERRVAKSNAVASKKKRRKTDFSKYVFLSTSSLISDSRIGVADASEMPPSYSSSSFEPMRPRID